MVVHTFAHPLIGLARFDDRNAWNPHHHGRFDSLSQPGPDRIH